MTRGSWSTGSRIREPEATSAEGYRLVWYHSTRKAELDAVARQQADRAGDGGGWPSCGQKLASPRTRYRERAKVAEAVEAILRDGEAEGVDRGHDRGADDRDVPPGAARPARRRDAVRAGARPRGSS